MKTACRTFHNNKFWLDQMAVAAIRGKAIHQPAVMNELLGMAGELVEELE